eukprot:761332-Hanusia_phi.AAC.1
MVPLELKIRGVKRYPIIGCQAPDSFGSARRLSVQARQDKLRDPVSPTVCLTVNQWLKPTCYGFRATAAQPRPASPSEFSAGAGAVRRGVLDSTVPTGFYWASQSCQSTVRVLARGSRNGLFLHRLPGGSEAPQQEGFKSVVRTRKLTVTSGEDMI